MKSGTFHHLCSLEDLVQHRVDLPLISIDVNADVVVIAFLAVGIIVSGGHQQSLLDD